MQDPSRPIVRKAEAREADVVRAAAGGDSAAARHLHDRYAPVVWAVAYRMAPDACTAEDWAQEAWLRIFRALPRYRGEARFSTWVHRVAVNAALQQIRARRARRSRERTVAGWTPRTTHATPALRVALERAIGALPAGMRRVVELHDVEGYPHAEVAAMLGIAEGTSKSQLARARAKLRDRLGGAQGASAEDGWQTAGAGAGVGSPPVPGPTATRPPGAASEGGAAPRAA